MKIAVVGAGFSGAVVARELALKGHQIDVFESRDHVAGNCHTQRDSDTGVLVHVYGPHIFHTSNESVWGYVQQFGKFRPFINRVKTTFQDRVFSLPINLLTINSFFGKSYSPKQAREFIATIGELSQHEALNFEEKAISTIGHALYEAFFYGYTKKQWGVEPRELPASILKRLPVRFDYNDNYYDSKYQGIPVDGYTALVANMLDHDGITVHLASKFSKNTQSSYDHVFYSGSIDSWFNFEFGRLDYRTLDFQLERLDGDFQGVAVMNYGDAEIPWTRISEHKHFAPWEQHKKTIIYREFSRACTETDIPYYPIRLLKEKVLLQKYVDIASNESGVTFLGRLGTYRYLDMHVTIAEAQEVAQAFQESIIKKQRMPSFVCNPLN
jgi:UDP-galactopyranose mutase